MLLSECSGFFFDQNDIARELGNDKNDNLRRSEAASDHARESGCSNSESKAKEF